MPGLWPDDWIGLDGIHFGLGYLVALAGGLLAGVVIRRVATWPARPGPHRAPTPPEVALLSEGGAKDPRLVILSSIAALRVAGALGVDSAGRLDVAALHPGATPLDRAVHDATRRGIHGAAPGDRDPHVVAAVAEVTRSATTAGWLLTRGERVMARAGAVLLLGLLAIGVTLDARNAVGDIAGDVDACMFLVTGIAGASFLKVDPVSRQGAQAIARLRNTYSHLRPDHAPAWATYGPVAAAMGVALWGAYALWSFDPAFATAAGAPRTNSRGGNDGGSRCGVGGDGGGDSGGGGCGGCGD